MANSLTNLLAPIYAAWDTVLRELIGYIPAVSLDAQAARASLGQTIYSPVVGAIVAADSTPGQLPPDTGDATIDTVSMTMTKSRHAPIRWTADEMLGLENSGNFTPIMQERAAQAIRTLINEVETDVGALAAKASRAYGTAGQAPFGTINVLSDSAQVRKILDDNGAGRGDLQLVLGSSAMANLRGVQATLFKVNEAGTDAMLREGLAGRLHGFAIRDSAAAVSHTKGTGINYLSDLVAGYAVGATTIHVDTGTGTIIAGDVVTFAGDTNKYVVATGFAGDGDGDIVLAKPGLRAALANDVAMTVGNDYSTNLAFARSAIVLATRLPATGGGKADSADNAHTLTDPLTGLSMEVALYREYLRQHVQVRLVWGCQLVKPEAAAILLG